ncbi:MAG TPA: c-type cytochrome biogenesis protein CcsB [Chloroflexia bacterium]|jgi:cytochrome c-type biogenesis protein CcsB|nr:c-type cytochrome biogenesis protein CcsB [Chloroflexia bacterium]
MEEAVFGFNEWTLTTASWVCYFGALLSFIGLLIAQATQLSRQRILAREAAEFGGVQPMFAGATGAGTATLAAPVMGRSRGTAGATETAATVPMGTSARLFGRAGLGLTIAGSAALGIALVMRSLHSGHIPYMSLYEICLMFTFGIAMAYLLIGELWLKARSIGAFALLFVYLIQSYALLLIPPDLKTARPLVPALQSSWLPVHVSMAIVAYSCFAVAAGAAIMYLLKYHEVGSWTRALPSLAAIDEFMFRAVTVGFPFQTLLLITGAYWAQTAWSKAWSWDPKEVWALITWLAYAAFLHVRVQRGWRGTTMAWMALAGFAVVMITFIGVNYLVSWFQLDSMHAYAGDMPGFLGFGIFGAVLVLLLGSIMYGEMRRRRIAAAGRARHAARQAEAAAESPVSAGN